jgi:peptide subunit release factor RF-3
LGVGIHPAPDEWDRLYNVDFYIQIGNRYIGLQIKPITYEQTPEIYRWKEWLSKTHDKFQRDKGGKVFIIFSIKKDDKKSIFNADVIDEIKKEIERLKQYSDHFNGREFFAHSNTPYLYWYLRRHSHWGDTRSCP